jgi:hypothetical protein
MQILGKDGLDSGNGMNYQDKGCEDWFTAPGTLLKCLFMLGFVSGHPHLPDLHDIHDNSWVFGL